ncbi:Hypothetical predicted protein [Paramuricea clavata]|uniref:Uncharacterized protein n=1 Tax=Paramuricea clavata TaxID=317549 RepID=A0A6S7I4Q1_PARCT|nr:Hypothetical predicted protein [Paramuricea clavata]
MQNSGAVNTNKTNDQARSGAERGAGMIMPASPLEQEVNCRFQIPRTINETRSETNEAEHDSSTANSGQLTAWQYNPSQNYGYGNSARRIRQPSPYTRRNQRSVSTSRQTRMASACNSCAVTTTMKEIVLLVAPNETDVPKYAKKVELHKNGMIMDAVEIDRNWSEKELREKIEALLADKLKGAR